MGMHKSGRNDTNNPGASTKQDTVLRDYIERKQEAYGIPVQQRTTEQVVHTLPERQLTPLARAKKKLSFDEWYAQGGWAWEHHTFAREVWEAAQENI